MIKKLIFLLLIILISCLPVYSQDVFVNGRNTNLYFDGISIPWSNLATRNYVLAPVGPDYGFCISIVNNNPTSSHSFSVSAFQSGDFNVTDYSHNTGRYAPLAIVGTPSPVAANATETFFVKSNGASKVAFSFTGGTTQAGNPDTFDIYGVQTTANGCGTVNPQTGQSYTLSTPNSGTSSTIPIQAISDGLAQSYSSVSAITNPATNEPIIHVNPNNGSKNIYYDKVIVSCTAACTLFVDNTSNLGTTCSGAIISTNLKLGNSLGTATVQVGPCVANPTFVNGIYQIDIAANTPITIDLKGLISPAGTTNGIVVFLNTITGTVRANLYWYEK